MKKTYILTLRVDDFEDGRDVIAGVDGMNFTVGVHVDRGDSLEIKRAVDNQLGLDDDNGVSVYPVDDFVEAFNDQHISDENHWLAYVTVLLKQPK